jgi:hypothetical protein
MVASAGVAAGALAGGVATAAGGATAAGEAFAAGATFFAGAGGAAELADAKTVASTARASEHWRVFSRHMGRLSNDRHEIDIIEHSPDRRETAVETAGTRASPQQTWQATRGFAGRREHVIRDNSIPGFYFIFFGPVQPLAGASKTPLSSFRFCRQNGLPATK